MVIPQMPSQSCKLSSAETLSERRSREMSNNVPNGPDNPNTYDFEVLGQLF